MSRAAAAVTADVSRETPSNRHGKPWSDKETDQLRAGRNAGEIVPRLAAALGRTEDAVGAKLGRIGLVLQPHRKPRHVIPGRRRRADREVAP